MIITQSLETQAYDYTAWRVEKQFLERYDLILVKLIVLLPSYPSEPENPDRCNSEEAGHQSSYDDSRQTAEEEVCS